MNSYIDFAQYCVSYYKSWSTSAEAVPKTYIELFKAWSTDISKITQEQILRAVLEFQKENGDIDINIFDKEVKATTKPAYYRGIYLYLLHTHCNIPIPKLNQYLGVKGNHWDRTTGNAYYNKMNNWLQVDKKVKEDMLRMEQLIEKQKLI